MDAIRSIRGRRTGSSGPRTWAVLGLPNWLVGFVILVVLADAAFFALAASAVAIHAHDLELFAGLLACSAATVELTRRVGENTGFVKDVHATWELPVAMLLPLAYAPVLPVVRFALTQWRVAQAPVYRRVFSAAAIGVSYLAAGFVFHRFLGQVPGAASDPARHALVWMLLVAVCAVVQWIINQVLVLTAVKGSDPTVRLRDVQFAREPVLNDVNEICVAVLVTFCVAASWIALLFALPFVNLLQRSLRHNRLLEDARLDFKTGLLNTVTWQRRATAEVARAVRTRSSLAVALLDIDRFKVVNDTYGHLLGDQVLKEIANTLNSMLREYDLAGRFGGEEFSVLLPQTRAVNAIRIAERIRSAIAALSFIAPGAAGGERVHVTVSIGVAALDNGTERNLDELLAAADAALYRAKRCGRDQVQMISTSRGLSAVSGTSRGISGAAACGDAVPPLAAMPAADEPSLFRPVLTPGNAAVAR